MSPLVVEQRLGGDREADDVFGQRQAPPWHPTGEDEIHCHHDALIGGMDEDVPGLVVVAGVDELEPLASHLERERVVERWLSALAGWGHRRGSADLGWLGGR